MTVKLLIEHHLEFLSLKGGCTGSSESTLVMSRLICAHVFLYNINKMFCMLSFPQT